MMYTKEQVKKLMIMSNAMLTEHQIDAMLSTLTPEPDKGLVEEIVLELSGFDFLNHVSMDGLRVVAETLASRFAPRDGWVSRDLVEKLIERTCHRPGCVDAYMHREIQHTPKHHICTCGLDDLIMEVRG